MQTSPLADTRSAAELARLPDATIVIRPGFSVSVIPVNKVVKPCPLELGTDRGTARSLLHTPINADHNGHNSRSKEYMMRTWQIQAAKARFSELVKRAGHAPQQITSYGRPVAVVLSQKQFEALSGQVSLADFMQSSPLAGHEQPRFERDQSPVRETEF